MAAFPETELTALRSATEQGAGELGARAEAAIQACYDELRQLHAAEAARLQEMGAAPQPSKRNRQLLYLDEGRRRRALEGSRRHLQAHPEWLLGDGALPPEELRARVALQHLAAVDAEDLSLPAGERRSEDLFDERGVCEQFLRDAGRSAFSIGGQAYSFSSEVGALGLEREEEPLEVERQLQAFEGRLSLALLQSLGDPAPLALVQGVSRAMSQSLLANVERVCPGPQVVVSGGEQAVRYELQRLAPDLWEVQASVRKWDFEAFVIAEESCSSESGGVTVVQCSAASHIARACTLRFHVLDGGVVSADVCGLSSSVVLLDATGKPIALPGQAKESSRAPWRSRLFLRRIASTLLLLQCLYCRRRNRGTPSGCRSLQALPTAQDDLESAMRAPLREPPA